MSVFRINKSADYTVMSNYHLKDNSLSLKAKGLLSQMLSLPDDWDYSMNGLAAINKENISAIKSALSELRDCGYLIIRKIMPNQSKSGRIEYIYDIYERPSAEKQEGKKQGVENLPVEYLSVESQCIENQRQLNTNNKDTKDKVLNNKVNNIYQYDEEFETLWESYPRKQGKEKAKKAYIKARSEGVEYEIVLKGLKAYIKHIEVNNIESRFIKHGATWFSGRCWGDSYDNREENKPPPVNAPSYDISSFEGYVDPFTQKRIG